MYSETTGSVITLDWVSTSWETCFPRAICFSKPYQFPMPLEQPTFRLPMASRSSIPPSCFTLVAEGSTGADLLASAELESFGLSAANEAPGQAKTASARISESALNFINISRRAHERSVYQDYTPGSWPEFSNRYDATSLLRVTPLHLMNEVTHSTLLSCKR